MFGVVCGGSGVDLAENGIGCSGPPSVPPHNQPYLVSTTNIFPGRIPHSASHAPGCLPDRGGGSIIRTLSASLQTKRASDGTVPSQNSIPWGSFSSGQVARRSDLFFAPSSFLSHSCTRSPTHLRHSTQFILLTWKAHFHQYDETLMERKAVVAEVHMDKCWNLNGWLRHFTHTLDAGASRGASSHKSPPRRRSCI